MVKPENHSPTSHDGDGTSPAAAASHYPPHSGNRTTPHTLPPHPPIALTLVRVLVALWPVSWPGTRLSESTWPRSIENAMGEFSPIVAIDGQLNGLHHPQPSKPRSHISICDGFCRYHEPLGQIDLRAANFRPKWRGWRTRLGRLGGFCLTQWHPNPPKTTNTTINR